MQTLVLILAVVQAVHFDSYCPDVVVVAIVVFVVAAAVVDVVVVVDDDVVVVVIIVFQLELSRMLQLPVLN